MKLGTEAISSGTIGYSPQKITWRPRSCRYPAVLVTNSASNFPTLPNVLTRSTSLHCAFLASPTLGRFVRREQKVLAPLRPFQQIVEHAIKQFVGLRVGHAELIVALRIFS